MTKQNLRDRLKSVVNPSTGADIISSNMVKSYDINDGKIIVSLKICKDYDYAQNIEEEIEEHVEGMKGFKGVEVKYSCD